MTKEELLTVIVQFTDEHVQCRPSKVHIDLDGGGFLDFPVPATLKAVTPPDEIPGVEAELADEILSKFASLGKRCTRTEMSAALRERSESAVHKALWKMKLFGALSHGKDSYGKGFGLPEWS